MAIFEKLVSRAKVLERAAETGLRAEQYSDNVRACSKSSPKRRSLADEKEDLPQRRDSRAV